LKNELPADFHIGELVRLCTSVKNYVVLITSFFNPHSYDTTTLSHQLFVNTVQGRLVNSCHWDYTL